MEWFTVLDPLSKIIIIVLGCVCIGVIGLCIAGLPDDDRYAPCKKPEDYDDPHHNPSY